MTVIASPRRRLLPLALTAVGLLAWSNLVVPTLPADTSFRAAVNVAGVLALVALARSSGLTWRELGIGPGTWRAGLRWGGGALAAVVLGYAAVLLVSPGTLVTPRCWASRWTRC